MTLLPGLALIALAAAGLVLSAWTVRQRVTLAAAGLVALVLALGTHGPAGGAVGYLPVFEYLPGWDGLRTPGRLVIWLTLALCLLAAGVVTALVETDRWRGSRLAGAALAIPVLLVLAEGLNTTPHPTVPATPAAFAAARQPVLVLPSNVGVDTLAMLWSTDGYPAVVNGNSAFTPRSQELTREATHGFPDRVSVDRLRAVGVRSVVVLPDRLPGTPWQDVLSRPVERLPLHRETVGDAVVFTLE
jgi:hypothetical protein